MYCLKTQHRVCHHKQLLSCHWQNQRMVFVQRSFGVVKVAPTGPIIRKIGCGVTLTRAVQTTHPPIDPLLRITNHSLHPRELGWCFPLYLLAQFFVRGSRYAVQAGLELAVQ